MSRADDNAEGGPVILGVLLIIALLFTPAAPLVISFLYVLSALWIVHKVYKIGRWRGRRRQATPYPDADSEDSRPAERDSTFLKKLRTRSAQRHPRQ